MKAQHTITFKPRLDPYMWIFHVEVQNFHIEFAFPKDENKGASMVQLIEKVNSIMNEHMEVYTQSREWVDSYFCDVVDPYSDFCYSVGTIE